MIDWYGTAGILVFYSIILGVGVWAGTKKKNNGEEEVMLAGRSIGRTVGILTLIATWAGGAYFTGIAESFFTTGLLWCQMPFGYSFNLAVGALLFAKPMREAGYITMLDPFQEKYGSRIGGLLFLPAFMGDILILAATLSALGVSLEVILDISNYWSVTISTMFAAAYTITGGLYSVTYTDVLQLMFMVFGLLLSFPFAINNVQYYPNDSPNSTSTSTIDWIGHVEPKDYVFWVEQMLILVFGGIVNQSFFQRILSLKPSLDAFNISLISATVCFLLAIPAASFGIVAKLVDWSKIPSYGKPFDKTDTSAVLPLVLRNLTPNWVAFFGLGAVSASVMASADSIILSSSSMFTRNIYKLSLRPQATEYELMCVLRVSVVVVSIVSCYIALSSSSIYYLAVVCSDIVYVVLFPQLVVVVHWANHVNSYGCLVSFILGLVLRATGGEPDLGIPPVIKYPWYDETARRQLFPYKTLAMLLSALSLVLISQLVSYVFHNRILDPEQWDVLNAFQEFCPTESQKRTPKESEHLNVHIIKYRKTNEPHSYTSESSPYQPTTTPEDKNKFRF
uniref:High-affinity choline transporter 1 n=1 Tax=Cacopsylla melanoneura TaxID=428564 RepID=A0A8D9F1U4_9HEMI